MKRRSLLTLPSLLALPAVSPFTALRAAEPFPSRPVTLLVGYPPGGSADATARLVAEQLGQLLRQTVIIENKPGAAGNIAAEFAARAPADGYTLLFGSSSLATNPFVYSKLRYDVQQDFEPVSLLVSLPLLVSVTPGLPVHDLKEFVALARSKPGQLSYGTSGNGSLGHLTMEGFKQANRLDVAHVPYKGSAPMLTALMGGEIAITFDATSSGLPLAKAGKLRALAVTSPKRLAAAPDIPTAAEAGFPAAEAFGWYGLFAPRQTPPDVVARVNAAVQKLMMLPAVREQLLAGGAELIPGTSQAFRQLLQRDLARFEQLVRLSGAKVD